MLDIILYANQKKQELFCINLTKIEQYLKNIILIYFDCFVKVAKKIIVTKIAYLVENFLYNKNILDYEQIRNRKQRLAINTIPNLIYNTQIVKNRDNIVLPTYIVIYPEFARNLSGIHPEFTSNFPVD
jgi:hypothetical protein